MIEKLKVATRRLHCNFGGGTPDHCPNPVAYQLVPLEKNDYNDDIFLCEEHWDSTNKTEVNEAMRISRPSHHV